MGQILTNELDKTSTNVATWHELKTKPRKRRRTADGDEEKENQNPKSQQNSIPPKETERANEAKAILRTWLRGRAAGAASPPASCGDAGRRWRAVPGMRRPAGGRPAGGPGPRWGSWRRAGRRACSQRSRRGRARTAAAAAASSPGAPAGRASGRARGVAFVQSVVSSLWRGRRAWRGRTEESLVSFHLKRVGWRSCLHLVCSERTFFFS